MKNNPFSLSFGKEPVSLINRNVQSYEIIDTFEDENPTYQVCMITGVRGSGKTVMLTEINKTFRAEEDWIVIDLSPERDLLQSFAANLSNYPSLSEVFREAKINLSFLGLGVEIEGVSPITDLNVAVTRMLEKIKKKRKRVLVTIDEAVCNDTMKEFVSLFQIYMRQDLPVFLLMTGLYENIYELQNEKTLTFLYRAPKIELRPLNIGMIAEKYKSIFELTDEEATEMAKETRGYPFAFQVLGYLCFKHNTGWHNVLRNTLCHPVLCLKQRYPSTWKANGYPLVSLAISVASSSVNSKIDLYFSAIMPIFNGRSSILGALYKNVSVFSF